MVRSRDYVPAITLVHAFYSDHGYEFARGLSNAPRNAYPLACLVSGLNLYLLTYFCANGCIGGRVVVARKL